MSVMSIPKLLPVRKASGSQHAKDQSYYRPLVAGAELFIGVRNTTSRSASFILSFAPPPRAEFDPIIGETSFPLR